MLYRNALVVGYLLIEGLTLVMVGCTSRKSEPLAGPTKLDSVRLVNGQYAYNVNCYQCHPNGEAGVGPSLVDKPLPAFMVKAQVRDGGGAMPHFVEQQISDDYLDALVAYLERLRTK
jgi:mono/diheme cytochrome c family protein